jgi:hypothetical protein
VRTVKALGFGPKGVLRCVLPFTVILKLRDIGGNVLSPYRGGPGETRLRQRGHIRKLGLAPPSECALPGAPNKKGAEAPFLALHGLQWNPMENIP